MATMVAVPQAAKFSSARSVLALLDEPEDKLKVVALEQLNQIVDLHWAEVADFLPNLEALSEDEDFPNRPLASLVASKVYYHLGELSDALIFALQAGSLFDVQTSSEFIDTMVSEAIEQYIKQRVAKGEVDKNLEAIVNGMFDRCFSSNRYKQALGIALESHRLDMIKRAIVESGNVEGMLQYCFRVCLDQVKIRSWRHEVLAELVDLHSDSNTDCTHIMRLARCRMLLNRPKDVASMLEQLLNAENTDNSLVAFQVAFDLVDDASQQFLLEVQQSLPQPTAAAPAATPAASAAQTDPPAAGGEEAMATEGDEALQETAREEEAPQTAPSEEEKAKQEIVGRLHTVLKGTATVNHHIDFLNRHCKSDMQILKNMKGVIEPRSSGLFTSLVASNALMHAGTTNDKFLRSNLDWLRQAQNWAKFTAIGSLGVIRRGQVNDGKTLLKDFLPGETPAAEGGFQEGGALYALGLINAERGQHVVGYLLDKLKQGAGNDVQQHGAALALGLAAFATSDNNVYSELRNVLYTDNTVAGEASALAMGLVMCGTGNETALDEMLRYAGDTNKEKIIRSLSLAVALTMYGKEQAADALITQMTADTDHLVRYGGMFLIALAYVATADNSAIKKLLHVAVSDVSDDVRRAAVTALGFVLAAEHEECPKVVALLAGSFNPHVRCGAAMAVGVSCAGTGYQGAIDLLLPMAKDNVDFVRQAAHISLAMVLVQVSETQNPAAKSVRESLQKVVLDKHEETLAKIGAVLAAGIIDAGGRNVTISLRSDSGFTKMGSVVGMAVFTQFWYWFPLSCFLGLATRPSALICVDSTLATPNMTFQDDSPAGLFDYPPNVTPAQPTKGKKGQRAVLSTTKKKLAKERAKTAAAGGEPKDQEMKESSDAKPENDAAMNTEGDDKETKPEGDESKKEKDPVNNPARVTIPQQSYIQFITDQRYVPVDTSKKGGFVVVKDTKPDEAPDLVGSSLKPATAVPATEEDEPEAPLPEPFKWP